MATNLNSDIDYIMRFSFDKLEFECKYREDILSDYIKREEYTKALLTINREVGSAQKENLIKLKDWVNFMLFSIIIFLGVFPVYIVAKRLVIQERLFKEFKSNTRLYLDYLNKKFFLQRGIIWTLREIDIENNFSEGLVSLKDLQLVISIKTDSLKFTDDVSGLIDTYDEEKEVYYYKRKKEDEI